MSVSWMEVLEREEGLYWDLEGVGVWFEIFGVCSEILSLVDIHFMLLC
jgi:hypothetical protein